MGLSSSLTRLNCAQFFTATNENLYKLLAAFFLIKELGEEHSNSIMAMIGALSILPFLLFSNLGGVIADRWAKNRVIWMMCAGELGCLLGALLVFIFHLTSLAYALLFLLSIFSAILSPSKYAILPQIVPMKRNLYANSVIAAFTFLGIILGTALASFLAWWTEENVSLSILPAIFLAAVALIAAYTLPKTAVENRDKRLPLFIYGEIGNTLKGVRKIPSLPMALFAFAYTLFLGGFFQLNLIPFAIEDLKRSEIDGGYLFLMVALGLGCGAFFTNRISKGNIHLSLVPTAGFGISFVLIILTFFHEPWWLSFLWMGMLGFLGGVFLVPPQAYLLEASPAPDRGRNFATANFFSYLCALLAAGALYLLNVMLHLSPSMSFFVIALFNLFVIGFIAWKSAWYRCAA